MALGNDSDRDWEKFGKTDPYFSVLTHPKFLKANLNDDSLQEFFVSGKNHVDHVYSVIRSTIRPGFQPASVLDYGCGVGRLVVSFAQHAQTVVGVDISSSMLAVAQENCNKFSASSARLLHVDDLDALEPGSFDLIHSFIVFQHIPVSRGELILKKLITLIAEGGIGAIHLTYSDADSGMLRRRIRILRKKIKPLHWLLNLTRGKPVSAPQMQMNSYSMNRIFDLLMHMHCSNLHVEFSDHGGFHGAMIYFEKVAAPLL